MVRITATIKVRTDTAIVPIIHMISEFFIDSRSALVER